VTTPPAPRVSILKSDAPVVPRIPAARSRWLSRVTPPTMTLPGLIDTIHQKMVVKKYKEHLIGMITSFFISQVYWRIHFQRGISRNLKECCRKSG
jgi:hypothetical protein